MPNLYLDRARGELLTDLQAGRRKTTLAESWRATEGSAATVRLVVVESDAAGRLAPVDLSASGDKPAFRMAARQWTPGAGTITLSYGGDTTPALRLDRLNAALAESALNSLPAIAAAGRVSVVSLPGDGTGQGYLVRFRATGDRSSMTNAVVGDNPPVAASITVENEGDSDEAETIILRFSPRKVASLETTAWTAATAATAALTTIATGSSTVGSTYRLAVGTSTSAVPRTGTFRLVVESQTTAPIRIDAAPADIEAAINAALGSTGTWRVRRLSANAWDIARQTMAVATITLTDQQITSWPTLTGTLSADSVAAGSLMAGSARQMMLATIDTGTGEAIYREELPLLSAIEAIGSTSPIVAARTRITSGAPTTGDDIADGYGIFSLWADTATDNLYMLADNTEGAAVWTGPLGSGGGEYANVVRDYSATGDGVADDTAEIQAAVDASLRIYIPDGTYNITSAILMREGTQIYGESEQGVIIRQLTSGEDGFNIGATQTTECVISNLTITGNGIATSTGTAIDLKPTGGSWFSSRHNISNITVNGFGRGLHAYDAVLLDVVNFQTHETNEGILLEDVDTCRLMNIGIQAVTQGTVDYGIKCTGTNTHAGTIYGAEIGNTAKAIVIEGGRWVVNDTNIETNKADGIIDISGSQTFVDLDRIRILTASPTVSGSAAILIYSNDDGGGAEIPQVRIGAIKIDIVGSTWYPVVVRGNYWYLCKPIYYGPQEGAYDIRFEEGVSGAPGGTVRYSGKWDAGFTLWTYTWMNGHPPSEANNLADVGRLFYATPYYNGYYHLKPSGHGGHYQDRMGRYRRAYFANDELILVYDTDPTTRTITTEATAFSLDLPMNIMHREGGRIVIEASGTFNSGGSDKAIKVRFEETGTDDFTTGALPDAGYGGLAWSLRHVITRRTSTSVVHETAFLIDGQVPIFRIATEAATLMSDAVAPVATIPLRLYATQTSVENSRVVWEKSDDTD